MKSLNKITNKFTLQIDKSADIIIKRLCEMQTTSPEHPIGYESEDYLGRFKFYCNKKGAFYVNEFIAPGIKKARIFSWRFYYVKGKVIDTDFDKCTVKIYWIFDTWLFILCTLCSFMYFFIFCILALLFPSSLMNLALIASFLTGLVAILLNLHTQQENKGANLNIMHNMVIERVNSAKKG